MIVKVCGIISESDAQVALDAGASALGFNFYRNSPRYLSIGRAAELVSAISGSYLRVGVFVNPELDEVLDALQQVPLDLVQIHGSHVPALPPEIRVWRAIAPAPAPPAEPLRPEAYLLDTPSRNFGGSGITFAWSVAANFPGRAIIAGGLDAENVAEAIRIAKPWGVDACSRLETAPGHKDPARVRSFVTNALIALRSHHRSDWAALPAPHMQSQS